MPRPKRIQVEREALRRALQVGLDELDRGEGVPRDEALALLRQWRAEDVPE